MQNKTQKSKKVKQAAIRRSKGDVRIRKQAQMLQAATSCVTGTSLSSLEPPQALTKRVKTNVTLRVGTQIV